MAAFDIGDPKSVVSPGGVGFDINCGVRLLRTNLWEKDVLPVQVMIIIVEGTLSIVMITEGEKNQQRTNKQTDTRPAQQQAQHTNKNLEGVPLLTDKQNRIHSLIEPCCFV